MKATWDQRYDRDEYLFGKEPADFLKTRESFIKKVTGQTALCVADGEGRNSVFLAQHGLDVTAIDSSPVGIGKAGTLAAERGVDVTFELADLRNFDWHAVQYDLVVAVFIQFADPSFRTEIFEGLKNATKPGGTILLHGYTPKQIEFGTGGPGVVENLYSVEMLRSAFDDLEIIELSAYEKEIDEGPGHSGMSALIDLVARKPS